MVDDKEEEEIEVEVEEKKDNTLKYIVILIAGVAIGLIIYKIYSNSKKATFIPYNGQIMPDNVEYHNLNIPQYRVPTTQQTIKNPLLNTINNVSDSDPIIVNGIKMNKKGEMLMDRHPCAYESVIIKRDTVTGEVVDIIKRDY
jgi:hypothetical protein